MYRHTNLPVDDCIRTGMTELQLYYKKTERDNREKTAEVTRKRKEWHRLSGIPKEDTDDVEEDDDHDKEDVSDEDDREEDNEDDMD